VYELYIDTSIKYRILGEIFKGNIMGYQAMF
jgi:hypothetical protein